MRLGLYGGSFDPIHCGHLHPVREARDALALDRVLFLPTARPPHKPERELAPAWARYAMVELALLREEGMYASPFEMRGRPSFTVDTLEHFHRAWPRARIFLIVGSDSFARLTAWREWRRILELAELAVLTRPDREAEARSPAPEIRHALASGRIHRIPNAPVAVSATEVRRAIAAGSQQLGDRVPPLVLDYIAKYRLYRSGPETTILT